ncbi:MAG: hypothetical protein J0L92_00380 [Deltaproteobacteria bacterium]|nr:hypothetical protein [Deltaproteobacteria bacterium]
MSSPARERALRAAMVVAGLSGVVLSSGCDRVVARVLDGTGMDGQTCAGWSIRNGSAETCCSNQGAHYDAAGGRCLWPAVPGPFVPPALEPC